MTSWTDRWSSYWFPPSSTRNLALCRIVAAAASVFWFIPLFTSLDEQVNLLEKNSEFLDPQLMISAIAALVPRDAFFTPGTFTALYWVTIVAGLAALVGLFSRASMLVLALGFWILVAHKYSYADLHHPEAPWALFLLPLAFAPIGERVSVDALLRRRRGVEPRETADTAIWPLKLAHVVLAMTYFSTGITKVISGGFAWMNGYTLQNIAFGDAVPREIPFGIWLGQQYELCVVLSVFTVLFEVFFFVSLFLPRTAPFFFINGVLFHIGLYAAGGHPFFPHIVLLLLCLAFLDPDWWRVYAGRFAAVRARGSREVEGLGSRV
jgi:hypothetical protein